jgi:hypothetical protein
LCTKGQWEKDGLCPWIRNAEIRASRVKICSAFPLDPGKFFNKNVYSPEDVRLKDFVYRIEEE